MEQLTLRPHHGVCIPNFTGKGYDEAFTENMTQFIRRLTDFPGQTVTLCSKEDVLCSRCPHNQNGCTSMEKVQRLDREVLAACGLENDSEISWRDFQQLVRQRIFSGGAFEQICGDCQWYELCCAVRKERE